MKDSDAFWAEHRAGKVPGALGYQWVFDNMEHWQEDEIERLSNVLFLVVPPHDYATWRLTKLKMTNDTLYRAEKLHWQTGFYVEHSIDGLIAKLQRHYS